MKELKENSKEFEESAIEDYNKKRYNVSVANFFRAIVNLYDYIIYIQLRIIPKNHNERFNIIERNFPIFYKKLRLLFKKYRDSYNLKLKKQDAEEIKEHLDELKRYIKDKERS